MIDYEIDLIKLILEDIKPKNEEQERIKLYLETHKGNCEECGLLYAKWWNIKLTKNVS